MRFNENEVTTDELGYNDKNFVTEGNKLCQSDQCHDKGKTTELYGETSWLSDCGGYYGKRIIVDLHHHMLPRLLIKESTSGMLERAEAELKVSIG